MQFFGTTNTMMENNLYRTIGYDIMALIVIVSNIEAVRVSDLLNWSISCPELDERIRRVTHEQLDLEGFLVQTFTNIRTSYAKKHQAVLQSEICELEANLRSLRFKNTSILERILGHKKRLFRLGQLASESAENQEQSSSESAENQ